MRAPIARWLGYVLATAPVWYVPWTLFPAVFGKLPLVLPLIAVIAVLAALRPSPQPRQPLTWALAAYGAAAVLAALVGVDQPQSMWGGLLRGTGLFALAAYGAWYWSARRIFDAQGWRIFWTVAVVAAAGEAVLVAIQSAAAATGGEDIRAAGLFGNPTYVAGYLAMAVFLCALVASGGTRLRKGLSFAAAAVIVVALSLTGARSGIVALAGGAAVAVAWYALLVGGRLRRMTLAFGGFALAAGVALVLVPPAAWSAIGAPDAVPRALYWKNYVGDTPRLIQWGIAWSGFLERPLVGWGPETYQTVFDLKYEPRLLHFSFSETVSDKPHNLLLEILVTGGVVLAAAFLGVLWTAVSALRGAARRSAMRPLESAAALGAMAAFLLHGAFLFETFPAAFLFVSVLAWIASRAAQGMAPAAPRPATLWATRIALVAYALIALAAPRSIRAQYAALVALEATTAQAWTANARIALETPTVYHREIVKQVARDFLNKSASGSALPETFIPENLPLVREQVVAAAAAHPRDFTLQFMEGQLWGLGGGLQPSAEEIEKALAALRRAEVLSPRRQAVKYQIAKTHLLAREPQKAVDVLRAAVADDDTLQDSHWFLALALIAAEQRAEGADEIQRALDLGRLAAMWDSRNYKEIMYAIDILAAEERYEAIVPIYTRLILLEPGNAHWHARLAATYEKLGKLELAAIEAQRAAELEPSFRPQADAFLRRLEDAAP